MNTITSLCNNLSVSPDGVLLFAGQNTLELAEKYGTPLYLYDEDRIRENCRRYKDAFKRYFPEGSVPLYAGKAACFTQMYRILKEEGMGVDVVSPGEIRTVLNAGFSLSDAFFHGNNKTDEDIAYAMDNGIGCFVADNRDEIDAIERAASERGIVQKILLRLTPGIDPHTYEAVNTGVVDCKFGTAIKTGQAWDLTVYTLKQSHIRLEGFHCHIGSQVFTENVFERAGSIMLEYMAKVRDELGYEAPVLNLGGGYGVRYTVSDPKLVIEDKLADVAAVLKETCERFAMKMPKIVMEPGRSIAADAGMTLYTAGSVKRIPENKGYVSVDGGMTDNPRYALYKARYTCLNAGRMNEPYNESFAITGRCCESGDLIQPLVSLPESTCRGDIIAVCTTGAYNYSMASNYNRIPRPPVVMLRGGSDSYVAVRRETLDDLISLDV